VAREIELLDQLLRTSPEPLHVAQLNVLVPTDDVGQAGELGHHSLRAGVEAPQRVGDQRLVLADERALDAPDAGVAERVQRRAAQPPQCAQRVQQWEGRRPEPQLAPEAQCAQQRRVQQDPPLASAPNTSPRRARSAASRCRRATSYSSKLGRPLEAFTEVRFTGSTHVDAITGTATGIPEVEAVFTIAGDPDALVWLRVRDVAHLQQVIDQLRRSGRVTGTKTLMVMGAWLRHQAVRERL
jgi:hypothetical protein